MTHAHLSGHTPVKWKCISQFRFWNSATRGEHMAKVIGVGGVFFKVRNGEAAREWYRRVLGLEVEDWGGVVFTPELAARTPGAATVFSSFAHDTTYFSP